MSDKHTEKMPYQGVISLWTTFEMSLSKAMKGYTRIFIADMWRTACTGDALPLMSFYFGCVQAINVLFAAKFGELLHVGNQLVGSTLVHNC
jgi:hypothetical protein